MIGNISESTKTRLQELLNAIYDDKYFRRTILLKIDFDEYKAQRLIEWLEQNPEISTREVYDYVEPELNEYHADGTGFQARLLEELLPCKVTVGKVYEILWETDDCYYLRDDIGLLGHTDKEYFERV